MTAVSISFEIILNSAPAKIHNESVPLDNFLDTRKAFLDGYGACFKKDMDDYMQTLQEDINKDQEVSVKFKLTVEKDGVSIDHVDAKDFDRRHLTEDKQKFLNAYEEEFKHALMDCLDGLCFYYGSISLSLNT